MTVAMPPIIQVILDGGLSVMTTLQDQQLSNVLIILIVGLIVCTAVYVGLLHPATLTIRKRRLAAVEILEFVPRKVFQKVASIRNKLKKFST